MNQHINKIVEMFHLSRPLNWALPHGDFLLISLILETEEVKIILQYLISKFKSEYLVPEIHSLFITLKLIGENRTWGKKNLTADQPTQKQILNLYFTSQRRRIPRKREKEVSCL
jgi:hypothetical protein